MLQHFQIHFNCRVRLALGQKANRFNMMCFRKQVYQTVSDNFPSVFLQKPHIGNKAGRLTGNINHPVDAVTVDQLQGLLVDALPGWVKNYEIRLFRHGRECFKYISGIEHTIIQFVQRGIF